MRTNIEGARLRKNLVSGNRALRAVYVTTATSLTLESDIPDFLEIQILATACAVRLPASTPGIAGRELTILNNSTLTTAARTITLKTSTGGNLGVTCTLVRNRMKKLINNGTNWFQSSSN